MWGLELPGRLAVGRPEDAPFFSATWTLDLLRDTQPVTKPLWDAASQPRALAKGCILWTLGEGSPLTWAPTWDVAMLQALGKPSDSEAAWARSSCLLPSQGREEVWGCKGSMPGACEHGGTQRRGSSRTGFAEQATLEFQLGKGRMDTGRGVCRSLSRGGMGWVGQGLPGSWTVICGLWGAAAGFKAREDPARCLLAASQDGRGLGEQRQGRAGAGEGRLPPPPGKLGFRRLEDRGGGGRGC